jgi:hypothetical protein
MMTLTLAVILSIGVAAPKPIDEKTLLPGCDAAKSEAELQSVRDMDDFTHHGRLLRVPR